MACTRGDVTMAGLLKAERDQEAASQDHVQAANTFIVAFYFDQATSLLNRGLFAESEPYFREALCLCPDHQGALNNLGTALWRLGRLHEAAQCYQQALTIKVDDFAVLNNLGNISWDQGRLDEALECYRRAVDLQPDSPEALRNLGVTLSDLGKFDEALASIHKALQLEPGSPDSYLAQGVTLARQGKLERALDSYERAVGLRPDFAEPRRNRAQIWLARGDFERGWPEYVWRLKCPKCHFPNTNCPRWTGDDLHGRSILLVAEQGLGDTLQFIRYASVVQQRGGRVVVACPEPLVRLVSRSPGVDRVVDWNSPLPDCDVHAPLLSLPAILRTTLTTIPAEVPYLSADADVGQYWHPVVAQAIERAIPVAESGASTSSRILKIGIAWQGNRDNKVDRWRSFPLTHFAHLARLPGVRLVSVQKGDGREQIADLAGQFRVAELNHPDHGDEDRRDFLDTAAVIKQLDLVVAPDTALAHLAGALGIRVFLAVPSVAEWRWLLDRDDSPWYPTMRIFRQTTPGDWEGVFEGIAHAVAQELIIGQSQDPTPVFKSSTK
jgi:tetratricopeptide (TPR) repeat protein